MIRMDSTVIHMDTPAEFNRQLAGVVREAMKSAGISQRAMAERTSVPYTTLVRRLSGRSPFSVIELAAISQEMGTSIVDLMLRAERRMPADEAA